jgi:hypothetical protein
MAASLAGFPLPTCGERVGVRGALSRRRAFLMFVCALARGRYTPRGLPVYFACGELLLVYSDKK